MAIGMIDRSLPTSVDTDFPDEADVAYEYGGDLKRRERTAGSDTTWYNWGAGYAVMGEEDGSGNLLRTYVGNLAHIDGASAASGTYSYYWHDHLGSTRTLYDGAKAETASFDYAPYGDPLLHSHGAATTRLYTGHDWDPAAGLYFAPFRYYNPDLARWITRDPLGMDGGINLYGYCHGNPVFYHDPDGRNPIAAGAAIGGALGAVAGACNAIMSGNGLSGALVGGLTGGAAGAIGGATLGALALANAGAGLMAAFAAGAGAITGAAGMAGMKDPTPKDLGVNMLGGASVATSGTLLSMLTNGAAQAGALASAWDLPLGAPLCMN